jgi:predicted metal-dependent hydrolase
MMETAQIGNMTYSVKRSNRKTLSLIIERDGAIIVRAPLRLGQDEIEKFVAEKRIWIQQRLARKGSAMAAKPEREFVNGQGFPYLGKSYRLKFVNGQQGSSLSNRKNGSALHLTHGYFELPEDQKPNARKHFISWYKQRTEEKLKERIPRYNRRIGVSGKNYRAIELRHRWASRSRSGVINFNWRSVMAPIWVFDYILVHEMVHVLERKHSKRFWQLVSRVMPDYEEIVRWLSENGSYLDL